MGLCFILLPGMHGTGELFKWLLEAMPAGVRQRVVEYPRDRALGYGALLKLIVEAVRGEEEMVVVGESFSGVLALRLAAACPGRVKGVVMVGGFVRPTVPRALCAAGALGALIPVPMMDSWIKIFLSGWDAPRPVIRGMRHAVWGVKGQVLARRMLAVAGLDAEAELRDCAVPVLYLAGRRDRMVGRRVVRGIVRVRGDVRVRTLEAPHLILQVRAREAWGEIEGWVREEGF